MGKKTIFGSKHVGKGKGTILSRKQVRKKRRLSLTASKQKQSRKQKKKETSLSSKALFTNFTYKDFFPMWTHSPFQCHVLQSGTVAVAAATTCSLSLGCNLGQSSARPPLSDARLTLKHQGNMFEGKTKLGITTGMERDMCRCESLKLQGWERGSLYQRLHFTTRMVLHLDGQHC